MSISLFHSSPKKTVYVCSECGKIIHGHKERCPECGNDLTVQGNIRKETVERFPLFEVLEVGVFVFIIGLVLYGYFVGP